jgi:hypothetical protein
LSHVQMLNLLQQPSIIRHLLHSDKLVYLDDIRSPMAKRRCLRCLFHSRSRKLKAIVMIASYRSLPELSSVQSLLAKLQVHYCIVLAAITRRHMAAFVVVKRGEQVFVKARSVFEVPSL